MISILVCALLAIVFPYLAYGDICDYVITKDCAFIMDMVPVCGTDGQTYRNACFLAKQYCNDNRTHKAHDGACMIPTTQPPPQHGSDVALDIFCLDLIYINCPITGPTVCGSNNKIYPNTCEFDKARCFHRALQPNGTCTAA